MLVFRGLMMILSMENIQEWDHKDVMVALLKVSWGIIDNN